MKGVMYMDRRFAFRTGGESILAVGHVGEDGMFRETLGQFIAPRLRFDGISGTIT